MSSIEVDPGEGVERVPVATNLAGGIHFPIYNTGFGPEGSVPTYVDNDNPLPTAALTKRADELAALVANGGQAQLQTDEDGALWVHEKHHKVDVGNSTTAVLEADEVFIGDVVDLLSYSSVSIIIKASHSSATDGMLFQFSPDGTNWDKVFTFEYTAGNGARVFPLPLHAQYFRIVYINGDILQTYFRVQTVLMHTSPVQTTHRLIDDVNPDRSGSLVKAALIAQKAGTGDLALVQSTTGGNLKFSLEEFDEAFNGLPLPVTDSTLEAAKGSITGLDTANKFGRNIQVDSGITADVWDGGHTLASGGNSLIWLAPTAARIHQITSSSTADDGTPEGAGAGAQAVRVWGLQTWDSVESFEDVILNGTANVATANSYVIINRMKTIPVGTTYNINTGSITATADTDNTVTARIRAGQGQTQSTIYGVPSTCKLYMGRLYGNVNKAAGAAQLMDMTLLVAEHPDLNATAFTGKHTFGLQTVGTSALTINYYVPKVFEGPAIIKIQSVSGTINMDVSAGFDAYVVAN